MTEISELMNNNYPLTILFDGQCPACRFEAESLAARDRDHLLRFIDISAAGFDPQVHGLGLDALNAEIHAIRPDGSIVKGVEVLKLAYEAVGGGWLFRAAEWPRIRPLYERGYALFARHRQPISRALSPLLQILSARQARQAAQRMRSCAQGHCDINTRTRDPSV
jgi:predicted DCC family thiol-disulfide oxidoreductase YuxK